MLRQNSLLDPVQYLRLRDSVYACDLLTAVISEFDFFNRFGNRQLDFLEIAADFSIAERPLDVLLTFLKARGLLVLDENKFSLTSAACRFFNSQSESDLNAYFKSLAKRPQVLEAVQVLRSGNPAVWESSHAGDWEQNMTDTGFARRFTAAMDGRGSWLAPYLCEASGKWLDGHKALLDIGGGSGIYAAAFASRFDFLECAVLEKFPVNQVCKTRLQDMPAGCRPNVFSGDMFQQIPAGFDVHLFSNVLHDWDEQQCLQLLKNSRRSLHKGDLLLIHDAFIDSEKKGPLSVAEYSVLLMLLSRGKCWSIREYADMLEKNGFEFQEQVDTVCDRGLLTARAV